MQTNIKESIVGKGSVPVFGYYYIIITFNAAIIDYRFVGVIFHFEIADVESIRFSAHHEW